MLFENLTFVNHIGGGSYGYVNEFQLSDKSLVAIKSINLTNQLSDDAIVELNALQILKNKPHIIQILGIQITDKINILLHRYTSSLRQFMKSYRSLQIFDILLDHLLKGLAYIHSEYIIHQDIKPENILVNYSNDSSPEFFYADFGLSDQLPCVKF